MKAEEIIKFVKFTDIKITPDLSKPVMQAVLCFKGKTKGGRWLDNLFVNTSILFSPGEEKVEKLVSVKKDFAVRSMFDFITGRTGVKGYKGRFIFVDFEPLY